jgi:tryptophan synthase alpha chain
MTKRVSKKSGTPARAGRIEEVFASLKERGEKGLVAFVTAGDPTAKKSEEIILAIDKAGADIIELGIPFSDPMADGPTIQASSERALGKGMTMTRVFDLVRRVRRKSAVPIVLFGYYNPIFSYGVSRFAHAARLAGADGVLVVDLPPEEGGELEAAMAGEGLDIIYLLTPTSDASRMKLVARHGTGFIYYVSLAGVTGARKTLTTNIDKAVRKVKRFTDLPVGVGFGISTPKQAREAAREADAVVVGSAIINVIAKYGRSKDLAVRVERFVSSLKKGIRT